MSARNDKYRAKISAACQPHVDEPIRAVGLFHPRGTWGAFAVGLAHGPIASALAQGAANEAAGDVPELGLYALTDSALHVMEGKPKGFNWKVQRYHGWWPRTSFAATPGAGAVTDKVELQFESGEVITLESMRMGSQGFNEDIISQLAGGNAVGG